MTGATSEGLLQTAQQLNPDLAERLVSWQRQQGRH